VNHNAWGQWWLFLNFYLKTFNLKYVRSLTKIPLNNPYINPRLNTNSLNAFYYMEDTVVQVIKQTSYCTVWCKLKLSLFYLYIAWRVPFRSQLIYFLKKIYYKINIHISIINVSWVRCRYMYYRWINNFETYRILMNVVLTVWLKRAPTFI